MVRGKGKGEGEDGEEGERKEERGEGGRGRDGGMEEGRVYIARTTYLMSSSADSSWKVTVNLSPLMSLLVTSGLVGVDGTERQRREGGRGEGREGGGREEGRGRGEGHMPGLQAMKQDNRHSVHLYKTCMTVIYHFYI